MKESDRTKNVLFSKIEGKKGVSQGEESETSGYSFYPIHPTQNQSPVSSFNLKFDVCNPKLDTTNLS
jgi:hypothetical protein